MGVWGTGSLDSDTAMDTLGTLMSHLMDNARADMTAAAEDGFLERSVLTYVACIRAILAEVSVSRTIVRSEELESLHDDYARWFETAKSEMGLDDVTAQAMLEAANAEFVGAIELCTQ